MRPSLERVDFGDAWFLTFERREHAFPRYWHYHSAFQLTLMAESSGRRFVGNEVSEYGPGDLMLLGSNLPHAWQTKASGSGRSHYAVDVQFRGELLRDPFLLSRELGPIAGLLKRSAAGLEMGKTRAGRRACEQILKLPTMPAARRAMSILGLLLDLALDTGGENTCAPLRPEAAMNERAFSGAMTVYLRERFDQPIDFCGMARHFGRSHASLCRTFKRTMGKTMTAYVNELRIQAAEHMLARGNKSITEIAFDAGFGNYSHFHQQFKKLKGRTPRQLRSGHLR